jgi:membrane protein YdbS with pleckstrin-like domain
MTRYEMPSQSAHWKRFRVFAAVAIILLLVILRFSSLTSTAWSDHTRKIVAWAAITILVASVAIAYWLAFKEANWRLKKRYRIEVSEGKLIQRRPGKPLVEIPTSQITSIKEIRGGWLIVIGGEPVRRIAVPLEITGVEDLKRELSENRIVRSQ